MPNIITREGFRPGGTIRPQAHPDRVLGPEVTQSLVESARRDVEVEQQLRAEAEGRLHLHALADHFDTIRRRFVPAAGESIEKCVAFVRQLRAPILTANDGPWAAGILVNVAPPEPLPSLADATGVVQVVERDQKRAARELADVQKRSAGAKAEMQKRVPAAEKAEADAADISRRLDAEREREDAVTAAGDLDAAEKWAAGVAEFERRSDLARKVAASKRSQAEAAARDVAALEGETASAQTAVLHAKAQLTAARLTVATIEAAAAIAKTVAPLVGELDRLLVELSAAGEDAGSLYRAAERVGAVLRAAALDG